MFDLYDLTPARLAGLLTEWDCSPAHAARIWGYLYRDCVSAPTAMNELPSRVRDRLEQAATITTLTANAEVESTDGLTRKWLLRLADGAEIETVLMRYRDRWTACVSSQVGCALGCVFCATG